MKTNTSINFAERACLFVAALGILLLTACAELLPTAKPPPPGYYSIDNTHNTISTKPVVRTLPSTAPSLVVGTPLAVAGFDSQRIIYVRQAHKLEYFAHNEWIDTPARMLSPLIVKAIENSGAFRAVLRTPSSARGDLRLDTEVLQLQQEFNGSPSRVRFVLRSNLVEDITRRVIASREFEAVVAANSDDPYGGVIAANEAVRIVLEKLAAFCAQAAANSRP